jgi:hypothetical protein
MSGSEFENVFLKISSRGRERRVGEGEVEAAGGVVRVLVVVVGYVMERMRSAAT